MSLMLRQIVCAGAFAALAGGAVAQEPADPVQAVMQASVEGRAYFDPQSLVTYFSLGFTRDLTAGLLHIKKKGGEVFIDWDPITGGQDGCGPKDVTYTSGPKGAKTTVTVQFTEMYCFGSGTKPIKVKVLFDMVQEGTAPDFFYTIDDIRHVDKAGKTVDSLREAFKALAAN
jgi:hypothetical protein